MKIYPNSNLHSLKNKFERSIFTNENINGLVNCIKRYCTKKVQTLIYDKFTILLEVRN